jgi:transposase
LGYDATSIHIDFKTAYGEQAPSYSTVLRWINRFKDGREDLEDDPRAGRQQTGLTGANIELVRHVIEHNPWSTYDYIEEETMLCRGTIHNIIHGCLKMK